ncbi:hypothetical protein TSMEX_007286 [Taenia solium]|eukprot:TsM_000276800 transcript=TsM_000276800 gene=TsM_000276800
MLKHHKKSAVDYVPKDGVKSPSYGSDENSCSKSVRISDDIFYLGRNEAVISQRGNRSGTVSPDSTYFSSIVSDMSEHQGNGAQRLLELRESLVQESERTARLLDAAIQTKYGVLDPDSLEVIKDISMEHLKERETIINRRLEALEEQIDLLKQHEDRELKGYRHDRGAMLPGRAYEPEQSLVVSAKKERGAFSLISDANAELVAECESFMLHPWTRNYRNLIIFIPMTPNLVAQPLDEVLLIKLA